jgi:hypothetical protein
MMYRELNGRADADVQEHRLDHIMGDKSGGEQK